MPSNQHRADHPLGVLKAREESIDLARKVKNSLSVQQRHASKTASPVPRVSSAPHAHVGNSKRHVASSTASVRAKTPVLSIITDSAHPTTKHQASNTHNNIPRKLPIPAKDVKAQVLNILKPSSKPGNAPPYVEEPVSLDEMASAVGFPLAGKYEDLTYEWKKIAVKTVDELVYLRWTCPLFRRIQRDSPLHVVYDEVVSFIKDHPTQFMDWARVYVPGREIPANIKPLTHLRSDIKEKIPDQSRVDHNGDISHNQGIPLNENSPEENEIIQLGGMARQYLEDQENRQLNVELSTASDDDSHIPQNASGTILENEAKETATSPTVSSKSSFCTTHDAFKSEHENTADIDGAKDESLTLVDQPQTQNDSTLSIAQYDGVLDIATKSSPVVPSLAPLDSVMYRAMEAVNGKVAVIAPTLEPTNTEVPKQSSAATALSPAVPSDTNEAPSSLPDTVPDEPQVTAPPPDVISDPVPVSDTSSSERATAAYIQTIETLIESFDPPMPEDQEKSKATYVSTRPRSILTTNSDSTAPTDVVAEEEQTTENLRNSKKLKLCCARCCNKVKHCYKRKPAKNAHPFVLPLSRQITELPPPVSPVTNTLNNGPVGANSGLLEKTTKATDGLTGLVGCITSCKQVKSSCCGILDATKGLATATKTATKSSINLLKPKAKKILRAVLCCRRKPSEPVILGHISAGSASGLPLDGLTNPSEVLNGLPSVPAVPVADLPGLGQEVPPLPTDLTSTADALQPTPEVTSAVSGIIPSIVDTVTTVPGTVIPSLDLPVDPSTALTPSALPQSSPSETSVVPVGTSPAALV